MAAGPRPRRTLAQPRAGESAGRGRGVDESCRPRRIRRRFRARRSVPASTQPPSCVTSTAAGPALSRTAGHCGSGTSWRWTRTLKSHPASFLGVGATTAASLARRFGRGRAMPYAIHFTNAGAHPHTIHFHGIHRAAMDGTPGIGAGFHCPRAKLHLRIRRHTVRHTPVPLPPVPAGPTHREGPVRRLHHRAQRRPTTCRRRDGDGDERLQHGRRG